MVIFLLGFAAVQRCLDFFILCLRTSVSFCEKPRDTGYNELPAWVYCKPQGKTAEIQGISSRFLNRC